MLRLRKERDLKMEKIWKTHTLRISARQIQRCIRNYQDRMKGYRFRLVVQAMRAKVIQENSRRFAEENGMKPNVEDDLSTLMKLKDDTKATMDWVNQKNTGGNKNLNDETFQDDGENSNYDEDEFDTDDVEGTSNNNSNQKNSKGNSEKKSE
eukprot:g1561.t1